MSDELPKLPDAPVKKKGGLLKKLLIPLVVLVVLGGAGGWWMMRGNASAEPAEPPLESRGLLAFEPFLVNLTGAGGAQFLKINLQIVVESAAVATEIEETPVMLMQVRSAILELLTEQTAPNLVTQDGKQALKNAIKERAKAHLHGREVLDVLFAEFVVQF